MYFHTEKQQNNMQCPDGAKITSAIIEFVMQEEGGDVETLRKALYCQVSSIHYTLLPCVWFALFHQIECITPLTFRGPCIVMYSYNKTNKMH